MLTPLETFKMKCRNWDVLIKKSCHSKVFCYLPNRDKICIQTGMKLIESMSKDHHYICSIY